jgi:Fic family protein
MSRTTPNNGIPLLPPKVEVETRRTLKKAIAANKALAELRTAGDLIPNQAILIRALVLQEAKLSSEVENIVTTNDELYRALSDDPEHTDPATKKS